MSPQIWPLLLGSLHSHPTFSNLLQGEAWFSTHFFPVLSFSSFLSVDSLDSPQFRICQSKISFPVPRLLECHCCPLLGFSHRDKKRPGFIRGYGVPVLSSGHFCTQGGPEWVVLTKLRAGEVLEKKELRGSDPWSTCGSRTLIIFSISFEDPLQWH